MVRWGLIIAGIIILNVGSVGYFWQTDRGYSFPQINDFCSSDLGKLAQWWGEQDIRENCNFAQMVTITIFGFVILGIALIIAGAVVSGERKESESIRITGKDEEDNDSLEILKKRYAKGEISKEEFDKMKEDLV